MEILGPSSGVYGGTLDNGGEILQAADARRQRLADDGRSQLRRRSWGGPRPADGGGPSLQLISLTHDNNWIGNWAVDNTLKYTPGAANSVAGVLPPTPELSPNGGYITPGFQVTITAPVGSIYYTLDGTDPTGTNGAPAPTAILYTGPVSLTSTVQLRARAYNVNTVNKWSSLAQAYYHAHPPASAGNLAITEIHYRPPEPTPAEIQAHPTWTEADFEFMELLNTSAQTISLAGMRLIEGVQYRCRPGPVGRHWLRASGWCWWKTRLPSPAAMGPWHTCSAPIPGR